MWDVGTAASVGMGVMEKQAEKREQNRLSAANRRSAIDSMNNESEAQQQRFAEDNVSAVQQAYELALQGRADQATTLNQAADSGVVGTSVNEGFFAVVNKTARETNRFHQELRSRKDQFSINMASLEANATNQINSAPRNNSNPLMGAVVPIAKGFSDGKFDSILKKNQSTRKAD